MKKKAARKIKQARASLENPSTPLSDFDDEGSLVLGGSSSGIRVNRQTALSYSAVWRAVSLISGTVGKLPIITYKRNGNGKDRVPEHPAFWLLEKKPNREMIPFIFKQTVMGHALLNGNGYAYIFRLGNGTPDELIILNPEQTYPVRENGKLLYVTHVSNEPKKLLPENVIHIKGLGFDGLQGYNVIAKARHSMGLGLGAREYGSRFFRNSARPSVVIEHPATLSPVARKNLRDSWDAMHSGLENMHRTAVLEEGMKVNAFSINGRDAQLLETRQFEIREIANWFGLPPHKLGDGTRVAYNSLEQENQSYLDDALDPWLVNLEEEFTDKLLTEKEKRADTHVIEFMRSALLRADTQTQGEFFYKATGGHPWMAVNEVRGKLNMNPMPGLDDIKPPTNNFGDATKKNSIRQATREMLVDAVKRVAKRLTTHARKAAKSNTLADWIAKELASHRAVLIDILSPVLAVASAVGERSLDAGMETDRIIDDFKSIEPGAMDDYEANAPESFASRIIGE